MDTFLPRSPFSGSCQPGSVRKHHGNDPAGPTNLHGGVEKGFLLLLFQVSQSSGTHPRHSQDLLQLSCILSCPPGIHHTSLSDSPRHLQCCFVNQSQEWLLDQVFPDVPSLALPFLSLHLLICLLVSVSRASRHWSLVDPPFPVYSKCSIKNLLKMQILQAQIWCLRQSRDTGASERS